MWHVCVMCVCVCVCVDRADTHTQSYTFYLKTFTSAESILMVSCIHFGLSVSSVASLHGVHASFWSDAEHPALALAVGQHGRRWAFISRQGLVPGRTPTALRLEFLRAHSSLVAAPEVAPPSCVLCQPGCVAQWPSFSRSRFAGRPWQYHIRPRRSNHSQISHLLPTGPSPSRRSASLSSACHLDVTDGKLSLDELLIFLFYHFWPIYTALIRITP